jgi:hypothetical protein
MSIHSIRDVVFAIIPLVLVLGALTIAVIDPTYRQPFMDLSKVFLGGMVGLIIPAEKVGLRRWIH